MVSMLALSVACLIADTDHGTNASPPLTLRLDPPIPEEDPDIWSEELELLLRYMCIILNCAVTRDAGQSPSVQQWITAYRNGGVRTGMTSGEQENAIAHMLAMRGLADRNPGVLSPELCSQFRESLVAALEDLGQ